MPKARMIITAVIFEKRPVSEVAREYGVARSWIYTLMGRYRDEGEAAFEPRSRRPLTSPGAISPDAVELIIRLRRELAGLGLDAGPHTIAWHLREHHQVRVSPATVSRYLTAHGLVTPQPAKRPRSSWIRFQADLPNECWQSDFTKYTLADGTTAEILTWLDDHSRLALSLTAHRTVTGRAVLAAFRAACARHGIPASTLTDNGTVYTARLQPRGAALTVLEQELARLGIIQKNGKPNHPQTQGKTERFQQTLKKWLTAQPRPATLPALQAQLDQFTTLYNTRRPHRALPGRITPATAYTARPAATPPQPGTLPARTWTTRISPSGTITLTAGGTRHHIGIGRRHARTPVLIHARDHHIRIIATTTGEILRDLTLTPGRTRHPAGTPKGRPPATP